MFIIEQNELKYLLVVLLLLCTSSCSKKDENNMPADGSCSGFSAPSSSNNGPVEVGQSIQLIADTGEPGVSFEWTGPNGFASSQQSPSLSNVTFVMNGLYYVKIANAECSSSNSSTKIIINAPCGTLAANTAVVGTQTWNFNSGITCNNGGPNSHYLVNGTYGSNFLDINFNKFDKPTGFTVFSVDGTGNPSFDSSKVQMTVNESGVVYKAVAGSVYVGNDSGILTASFCNITFTNSSNGTSKTVRARLSCN
ncbi:MAG: hypothetical protein ACHQNT_03545 [Bacteroidia bacterium]